MKLADLKVNHSARIVDNQLDEAMARRLWDLGFTKGTLVEAVQKSPSGDPTAYKVRGTIFAIRQTDAEKIEIQEVQD